MRQLQRCLARGMSPLRRMPSMRLNPSQTPCRTRQASRAANRNQRQRCLARGTPLSRCLVRRNRGLPPPMQPQLAAERAHRGHTVAASGAAAPALPAAEPKKKRRRRGESAASGAAALEEPKQKRRRRGDGAASAACAAAAAELHESTGADLEDTLRNCWTIWVWVMMKITGTCCTKWRRCC